MESNNRMQDSTSLAASNRDRLLSLFRPLLLLLPLFILIGFWDVFPSQDLPQHLAMGKIFLDYDHSSQFQSFYKLPEYYQSYFTLYYLLLGLGYFFGIINSIKIITIVYAIGLYFAFSHLRQVIHKERNTVLDALLVYLFVFNGAFSMGLFSFSLAIPFFIAGSAQLIEMYRVKEYQKPLILILLYSFFICLFHVVALAGFSLLVLITALSKRSYQWRLAIILFFHLVLALFLAGLWHGSTADVSSLNIKGSFQGTFGFEFLNSIFGLTWSNLVTTINYLLWNLVGPFSRPLWFIGIVLFIICFFMIRRSGTVIKLSPFALPFIIFFVISTLLPWGVGRPSEVTFLNFRMISIGIILLWSLLPPDVWNKRLSRTAILLMVGFVFSAHMMASITLQKEAGAALSLIKKVPSDKVLLSLVYHSESRFYGKMFRVSHFLPMYFTISHGGIATQFWAKYTDHLPIDYKDEMKPRQPADWDPQKFNKSHMRDIDYVLVQQPPKWGDRTMIKYARQARRTLRPLATRIECQGYWCLYKKNDQ
jgi:hypothetical protein